MIEPCAHQKKISDTRRGCCCAVTWSKRSVSGASNVINDELLTRWAQTQQMADNNSLWKGSEHHVQALLTLVAAFYANLIESSAGGYSLTEDGMKKTAGA